MATNLTQFGLERIYTDSIVDQSTVIDVLAEVLPKFQTQSTFIKQLIDIFKGKQEILNQQQGIVSANEKIVFNYIKLIIKTVAGITLNKSLSYVPHENSEQYKSDIDIITKYMIACNEHKYNIETLEDMLTCGIGYQYSIQKIVEPIGNVKKKYFQIGRFAPENTCCVQSYEIGNPIVLTFHAATLKNADGEEITRYTCFDSKYKYIIESDGKAEKGLKIIETPTLHDLPFNPIQCVENDIYRLSLTADLVGAQDSFNMAASNYNNDILLKINQILVIIGAGLDDKQRDSLRDKGILFLPPSETGSQTDVKFVSSQLNESVLSFLGDMKQVIFELGGCPTQGGGRAETGKAVETQNGHTLANFSANARELAFITPKREQLDNIITILKRNGEIASDICSQDIDIKFDRKRLSSALEDINMLETMIRTGVDPYDAVVECGIFDDNNRVANGIKATLELRQKQEIELKEASKTQIAESTNTETQNQGETGNAENKVSKLP